MSDEVKVEVKKNSFATAGFVLGIIAMIFSFLPFINYFSFVMGFLAVLFGIIGLIKKGSKGIAIAAIILGVLSLYIAYSVINSAVDSINKTVDELNGSLGTSSSEKVDDKEKVEEKTISLGETITGKDWEVTVESAQFSQRVDPPDTSSYFYNYYQVKDTENTYLYVVLNCKNMSELELGADDVATVTAKYNDKYEYSSFDVVEGGSTGFTYTNITNIKPLTAKKVYYLAEMPKSIADETDTPVEIQIKIEGQAYKCKIR